MAALPQRAAATPSKAAGGGRASPSMDRRTAGAARSPQQAARARKADAAATVAKPAPAPSRGAGLRLPAAVPLATATAVTPPVYRILLSAADWTGLQLALGDPLLVQPADDRAQASEDAAPRPVPAALLDAWPSPQVASGTAAVAPAVRTALRVDADGAAVRLERLARPVPAVSHVVVRLTSRPTGDVPTGGLEAAVVRALGASPQVLLLANVLRPRALMDGGVRGRRGWVAQWLGRRWLWARRCTCPRWAMSPRRW